MAVGGFILAIIAVFLPPLAVLIRTGCGLQLIVNIALTILAWIPGVIHAWFVILEYPSHRQRRKERRRSGEKVIVKEYIEEPPRRSRSRDRSRSRGGYSESRFRSKSRGEYSEPRSSHGGGYYEGRRSYEPVYARPPPIQEGYYYDEPSRRY